MTKVLFTLCPGPGGGEARSAVLSLEGMPAPGQRFILDSGPWDGEEIRAEVMHVISHKTIVDILSDKGVSYGVKIAVNALPVAVLDERGYPPYS